jgi:hypothetical protein
MGLPFQSIFRSPAINLVLASLASGFFGLAADDGRSPYDLKKARQYWAFQPIRKPAPPSADRTTRPANAIDLFIGSRLKKNGLQPAAPASREQLIRRVSFDLTGLPPTPDSIQAFVADRSPNAYARLVDRLLGSVHFGERWAQHWLDTVRFAESEGFEYDRHLPDAWRFRDYVIDSLNQDKPFDRFVMEQIAGDELAPQDATLQTAAIFHRLGPVRRNAGNPDIAVSRNEVLTERTDVLGPALLGLSVGCARCHDHRLDPISQKDYYRLQAYLAATEENNILLVPESVQTAYVKAAKDFKTKLKELRTQLFATTGEKRGQLEAQVRALEATQPTVPATIPSTRNDFEKRTAIHVLHRGDWDSKGAAVGPRPLSVLVDEGKSELAPDCSNPRTELARWLTAPTNPLTARVIVNRIWQHHFGRGLVKTPNDFGSHGDRPSHPELLDWLAADFIASGWSVKRLHRLILQSSTYRQSSDPADPGPVTRLDPENRLLSHFNRRRLSAEEIRDAMLQVAGRLTVRIGGRSVIVPVDSALVELLYNPEQWLVTQDASEHDRRSVYLIAKRNLRLPFMEAFDQPALQTSCGRRETSTHAPQALAMLNGELANALAQSFAQRLDHESFGNRTRLVERGFQLATGRLPTAKERGFAAEFLHQQPIGEFALALFNLNAFLYVE